MQHMEHRKDIFMQLKDHALKAVSPSHLYHKYSRSDFLREKMFMNVVKNIFIRFPSLQFDHHHSWCQITIRCTRLMEKVWEIHHYLWITPTKPLFAVWKIAQMFLVKFFRATMQTPLQVIKNRLMGGKSLIYENNSNQMVISEQPPQAISFKRDMQAICHTPDFWEQKFELASSFVIEGMIIIYQ